MSLRKGNIEKGGGRGVVEAVEVQIECIDLAEEHYGNGKEAAEEARS